MTPYSKKLFSGALALISIVGLSLLTGCKSYKLGHPAELPFETIYIQPAKNDSFAPQAQALVSSEVREAVIRDGRTKLTADKSEADAVLFMTITDYDRRGATRQQSDTEVAQTFDLIIRVNLDLYDQRNGDYYFEDRQVYARENVYISDPFSEDTINTQGLVQSEYNAMPRLARELGRRIADEVLSTW